MCRDGESYYTCVHLEIKCCPSQSLVQGDRPAWKQCVLCHSQRCVLICGTLPHGAAWKRAVVWVRPGKVIRSGLIWLVLFIPQERKVLWPQTMHIFVAWVWQKKKRVFLPTGMDRVCCVCLCWSASFAFSFENLWFPKLNIASWYLDSFVSWLKQFSVYSVMKS